MKVEVLTPGASYEPSTQLSEWLDGTWPAMWSGFDVVLPEEHYAEVRNSWETPTISEPHGHVSDRVLARRSGSRIHAREWPTGVWTTHVDRYDPGAGAYQAAAHVATETALGKVMLGVLTSSAIAYAVGLWGKR